ncbi:MAG: aldehyde dehydrogenase family protein, partial [Flavobacteriales bacterium]|nr:aldehyde dehydrogenase family protein [Flavobacteriales bacterium]
MANDFNELFEQQKDHFIKVVRHYSINDRRKKLKSIKDWIRKNENEIVKALHDDFRKPAEEIKFGEIKPVLGEINDALINLRKWSETTKVDVPIFLLGTRGEVRIAPKGVVLVVAPWNFPFNLTIGPLVSAIAAGNCVTVKPSELTPNTEQLIVRMLSELFDEKEIAVVTGDAEVGAALLKHPWNHIFFTGSPQVGKIVMR